MHECKGMRCDWGYRGWRSGSSSLSSSSEMFWNTHTHRWDKLWPPDLQSSPTVPLTSYSSSSTTSCFSMSIFTEEHMSRMSCCERITLVSHTDQQRASDSLRMAALLVSLRKRNFLSFSCRLPSTSHTTRELDWRNNRQTPQTCNSPRQLHHALNQS